MPHFEPLSLASLRALSLKTLFLLALATAKRVGELQALSSVVTFVGGDACLSHIPQFVAKSESLTRSIPRSFLVKSLSDFAAGLDDDLLLCPVRPSAYIWTGLGLCLLCAIAFSCRLVAHLAMSKNAVSFFLRSSLLLLLFFRLHPTQLPPPPPILSLVSAPSLVGFLLLSSFSFVSFSSSFSLGFPPCSSFYASLPLFSPAFETYCFLLYVFLCFLGSFFLRFFLLHRPFLPSLLLSFSCLFLSLVFSSSFGPFSLALLSFISFFPLSVFRSVFLRFPFACICVLAVCSSFSFLCFSPCFSPLPTVVLCYFFYLPPFRLYSSAFSSLFRLRFTFFSTPPICRLSPLHPFLSSSTFLLVPFRVGLLSSFCSGLPPHSFPSLALHVVAPC